MNEVLEPLDGTAREAWFDLVRLMTQLPAALDRQLQAEADLTCVEFYVLEHLASSPGRSARLSAVAQLANTSLSRLSHICSRLEADGLLTRSTDPADRRATLATLTDAGQRRLERASPSHWRYVRGTLLAGLAPADVEALARISATMLEGLRDR